MPAAGLAGNADPAGVDAEFTGMGLQPPDGVVDIRHGGEIAVLRLAEIQPHHGEAVRRQQLVAGLAAGQAAPVPGPAMQVQYNRKRPGARRPVKPQI